MQRLLSLLLVAAVAAPVPALAQSRKSATPESAAASSRIPASDVDFGDDSGQWAKDGECDDPRFRGPGMTATTLLDADIRADATDCRAAYEAGELTLRDPPAEAVVYQGITFGDDSSQWAEDGECDDRRFEGVGMSNPPLMAENERADAADCLAAFKAGSVRLRPAKITSPVFYQGINFGTDSSEWAQDGECDDSRFAGEGMTATPLLDEDIRGDASDCLEAFKAGRLKLAP
ncbi:hypothetical protein [Neomegalonema perideroedes]|uniref:hypothetical protein n=1 Tax=Neomegalonema perideroedes TaxID=217219 RepID=UPI00037485F3|nr:hypothetical protein [Neomegalonema perideroedes]